MIDDHVSRDKDIPSLNWDLLITFGIPMVTSYYPSVTKQAMFQAIASTLIYGKQNAVVVDAFKTTKQSDDLINWIVASCKKLSTI
jgi:hypothetical protein